MSTQLKPYLKEIADKIRDNRENLYQKFLLYNDSEINLLTDEWTVWPYNFGITNVSKTSAGVRIETDGTYDSRYYFGVFIKIGTCEDCNGKTFIASIDPVENTTITFGSADSGWDATYFGEEGNESITHKYLLDIDNPYVKHNWFGLWIMCNSAGTYDINNIVIKDISPINAKDYPTEIDNVGEAKYNEGHNDGYISFWEDYIGNGIEKSWTGGKYAFAGNAWNDETFNPHRDIYKNLNGYLACESMFSQSYITDVKGILERNGVKLITKNAVYFDSFAYGSKITRFPELDMSSAQRLSQCFYGCTNLKSIDKIILSSGTPQVFTNTFYNCSALEEIRFDGFIRSNISFAQSLLLSYESLKSIIDCLYDFVSDLSSTTCTLTLHADAKARLTNSDIAKVNAKGWTVA